MEWPIGDQRTAATCNPDQLLAIVEAEVGSLVELLPVALLVTSESGIVLRTNTAALALLGWSGPIVGQQVDDVLRQRGASARMRLLRHPRAAVRVYVLQAELQRILLCTN